MWAQHRAVATDRQLRQLLTAPRIRHVHRTIAVIFTITVLANFLAMPWGPTPPWITYAPLPPLFVLMGSGLYIMAARRFGWVRSGAAGSGGSA